MMSISVAKSDLCAEHHKTFTINTFTSLTPYINSWIQTVKGVLIVQLCVENVTIIPLKCVVN